MELRMDKEELALRRKLLFRLIKKPPTYELLPDQMITAPAGSEFSPDEFVFEHST